MKRQGMMNDKTASRRADSFFRKATTTLKEFVPEVCTYCGEDFDFRNVDALHRFTPLCVACYSDDRRREVTARTLD
jgi:hypothetical protein